MLSGRRIVLGVTGGIAAYKAIEVCRRLVDAGAFVSPVLTAGAQRFVGATTFSALASEPVRTSLFDDADPIPHTRLGQSADLVLVVPALAIDLLLRRVRDHDWWLAPAIGIAFVATLLATQWLAADFLLSPAARNWFFGADRWDYNIQVGAWRYQYWQPEEPGRFLRGLGLAAVFASVSARIGLWWGRGMARADRRGRPAKLRADLRSEDGGAGGRARYLARLRAH